MEEAYWVVVVCLNREESEGEEQKDGNQEAVPVPLHLCPWRQLEGLPLYQEEKKSSPRFLTHLILPFWFCFLLFLDLDQNLRILFCLAELIGTLSAALWVETPPCG